ncbi:hypothetical protein BSKO_03016 [Bryopsis sp. KO-2023]|nr:hypothetical protein BSKO_03016 [Bryopsis sp. KO-2023]
MTTADPAPSQFFCLSPPPPGTGQQRCVEDLVASLDKATGLGARMIDITDVAHLEFLGDVLRSRRSKFVFALRFGRVRGRSSVRTDSSPRAVRRACEHLLWTSNIGYVDLFYQEVADPETPIERTMWELRELVSEGKVKYVGLAVDDTELLKRACKIQPVACVCLEWSLWKQRSLDKVVGVAREQGLAILARNPLGGCDVSLSPFDSRPDAEGLSEKVGDMLNRQNMHLMSKLEELTLDPGQVLADRVASVSAAQDCRITSALSSVLDKHFRVVEEALAEILECTSLVNKLKGVLMNHNAAFIGKTITVTINQRKRLLRKLETWREGLATDGSLVVALQKTLFAQGQHFVNKVLKIRLRQNEALLRRVSLLLPHDSEVQRCLGNVLVKQRDGLKRWLSLKKDKMATNLLSGLEQLRSKYPSTIKGQLLEIRKQQESQVLEEIVPLLGEDSRMRESMEGLIQNHSRAFEDSLAETDFLHEGSAIAIKFQKLAREQSDDMLGRLPSMVEGSDNSCDQVACGCSVGRGSHEEGDFSDCPDPSTALKRVSSVMSGRVREVASRRGCKEQQVALAWMVQQGEDVLPVVRVKDSKDIVSVVEGTRMALTDEEMVILYAGNGVDPVG